MRLHRIVFAASGLMLLSAWLLAIGEDFVRASSVFTGTLLVGGVGWGVRLTEQNDAARRAADAEEQARLSKKNALK